MSDTADEVMQDKLIGDPRRLLAEYKFNLGTLSTAIRIRLYKVLWSGHIEFEQSHFLKTPILSGPYRSDATRGTDEADALRLAIRTLTTEYRRALNQGYEPQDDWLVDNAYFS